MMESAGSSNCCNCHESSRCLMTHCSCFAAGKYCTSCSCKNCCNKLEFVHRVFEKKLNSDSPDPFLSPSKFLEGMSEQPEKGTHITPASAGFVKECKCQNMKCLRCQKI